MAPYAHDLASPLLSHPFSIAATLSQALAKRLVGGDIGVGTPAESRPAAPSAPLSGSQLAGVIAISVIAFLVVVGMMGYAWFRSRALKREATATNENLGAAKKVQHTASPALRSDSPPPTECHETPQVPREMV